MTSGVVLCLIAVALLTSGCHEQRRYGDDQDGALHGGDQCDQPVSQRHGGWVCPPSG